MRDPEGEYESRLSDRRKTVGERQSAYNRLGNFRLGSTLLVLVAIWFAADLHADPYIVGGCGLVIFVSTLVWGDRLSLAVKQARRSVTYFERALERVRSRRNENGESGERFLDPAHPYAVDLDIFGNHSLFQWLSVCRTRAGENLLANWLLNPADAAEVLSRHEALEDLRDRLDLRESLAVMGEDFGVGGHPTALAAWAIAPPVEIGAWLRYVAAVLSAIGLAMLGWWAFSFFADTRARAAMLLVGVVEAVFFFRWRGIVNLIAEAAEEPGHDLALLRDVLARIERETFAARRLVRLRGALDSPRSASSAIRDLNRLVTLLESRDNWFLRVFGPLILWTTQVSFAVELWRQKYGRAIPAWLEAVAEFEALSSLASARYEHPEDILPEVLEGGPSIAATSLIHPLLPHGIPNDIALGTDQALFIVSGSNMSGKSTLLRTIGTNVVLALAGAPVRATSLRVSRLFVGASIRTTDSLEGGISRFYAEILRIRQILNLPAPALFLLDELLAGTNSHDRRIGAGAILRSLLQNGALGLATTHDLALVSIGDDLKAATNVHFEDFLENGQVHFDYRMRPGPVTRSNALELMRSVGLNV